MNKLSYFDGFTTGGSVMCVVGAALNGERLTIALICAGICISIDVFNKWVRK